MQSGTWPRVRPGRGIVSFEDRREREVFHLFILSIRKSGLYTVKTSTGATLTLAEAAAVRHGHSVPKVGDEMTLWVNEGNMVMDACPKGQADMAPCFISGTLTSIDYGKSRMTLSIMRGEQSFILRPENRMFRDIAVGARVTIEVNDIGEVTDIHKDKKQGVSNAFNMSGRAHRVIVVNRVK